MIAWVYSDRPKPEASAKTPFWISPVLRLAVRIVKRRKIKYTVVEVSMSVDIARIVKEIALMINADVIRVG